jgi:hypothetical protein
VLLRRRGPDSIRVEFVESGNDGGKRGRGEGGGNPRGWQGGRFFSLDEGGNSTVAVGEIVFRAGTDGCAGRREKVRWDVEEEEGNGNAGRILRVGAASISE